MSRLLVALVVFGPCLDDGVGGSHGLRLVQCGVGAFFAGESLQVNPTQDRCDLVAGGLVPNHVETDVKHALTHSVGQRGEVEVRPDVAAPATRAQQLEHRRLNRRGPALGQLHEFGIRARALKEGHLQRSPMLDRAACDFTTEFDDLLGDRSRIGLVESFQCSVTDAIELGVVTPGQLDEDRFLRLEVVVEAAREDPGGVGDLLQGRAKAGRCDDGVRRQQDLGPPSRIDRRFLDGCARLARLRSAVSMTLLHRSWFSLAHTERVVDVWHAK
jgi:hypothetical protein